MPVSVNGAVTLLGLNDVAGSTRVLAQSAVQVNLTGTTTETALATISIPALGPRDSIRVYAISTNNNNANNKTLRLRYSGVGGTSFMSQTNSTNITCSTFKQISNRNSTSSQVSSSTNVSSQAAGTSAVVTATVDTSVPTTLVITGELTNIADTISLEMYLVEIVRGV